MTPLGFNPAAASEAAALFPLSAAGSPPAETSSADATAFADLLAANFAPSDQTAGQSAGADSIAPAFNTLSFADAWFAGLSVDLNALNAGLEAEEAGVAAAPADTADLPTEDADGAELLDDDAALSALAASIVVPVSLHITPPGGDASAIEDADSVSREAAILDSSVGRATTPHRVDAMGTPPEGPPGEPEGIVPIVPLPDGAGPRIGESHAVPMGQALSGPLGEPEGLAAHAVTNTALTSANPADVPATSEPAADTTSAVSPAPRAAAATAPHGTTAVPQAAEETVIEAAPSRLGEVGRAVQHIARTREHVAAKLTEMSGFGQTADAAAKPVSETNVGADSQSQTEDGGAKDTFATIANENAVAPRSSDSATTAPVFTTAPPVNGTTKAVLVEGSALPQAPAAASVPDPGNVGRLIESMRVQMREGVQEATVRLKPEHMGEVTISIRVERGAVSAIVHAETPAVQQWLESQEDKLRSGLSDQGLHLERFIVQRDGSQERRGQQRQQPTSAPRYRQQRDDETIRFEVLV